MKDTETFIKLKYEFKDTYPDDWDDWGRIYNTYPKDVVWDWNWRCLAEVEHLATTEEAKSFFAYAKSLKHKKGDLTDEEKQKLEELRSTAHTAPAAISAIATLPEEREDKWKQYQGWLKEMLIEYEDKQ